MGGDVPVYSGYEDDFVVAGWEKGVMGHAAWLVPRGG